MSRVTEILRALTDRNGPFEALTGAQEGFTVRLRDAEVPARIGLDGEGRIQGLFFHPAVPVSGGIEDHVRAIAALPGCAAVLVASEGQVRAEHAADRPLAVGSAFKLAVLRAVAGACADGRLAWDRVVRLDPGWRSLPTGLLQDWPAGAPLTVATLANLMIAQSDNTATDALIRLVGREAVETLAPRNAPFPTTREAFLLKRADAADLRQVWASGDAAGRRALLAGLADRPLPRADDLAPEATLEVEWLFTARELEALMRETHHLPALAISPGAVPAGRWRRVAYKGGSETGVLNLTALVTARSGIRHGVVATWNDTRALDPERLLAPFRGILRRLDDEA
ncbi:serine hydrolase [Methylobacterium nonmethylotrophicum]|uniref:Serine hydrolase n=1 Tax=Methylobacterium nonmethylotrophicum TaxID=1141884 RepID=A0A4Z0NUD1_9HYPH|nr:serine hydrolase [Methylobacterium nonmethylotrophicum]TGE00526.1 serine hydrolase [Methylobacterium nonmethylotrophicum]